MTYNTRAESVMASYYTPKFLLSIYLNCKFYKRMTSVLASELFIEYTAFYDYGTRIFTIPTYNSNTELFSNTPDTRNRCL